MRIKQLKEFIFCGEGVEGRGLEGFLRGVRVCRDTAGRSIIGWRIGKYLKLVLWGGLCLHQDVAFNYIYNG